MKCVFDFPVSAVSAERQVFQNPVSVVVANTPDQVLPAFAAIEEARRAGLYAVGFVGYGAAVGLDEKYLATSPSDLPLLHFGLYHAPQKGATEPAPQPYSVAPWALSTTQAQFMADVERCRALIRDGVAYQINYTTQATSRITGDLMAYYEQLRRAQSCHYCAFLDLGDTAILSASPELFFRIQNGVLTTRPMKGTARRGRWPDEDKKIADALFRSEKERAENLMIVDLLRNDVSRVSVPHGVSVTELFNIERYPTLFQMTSTIEAKLRDGVGLADIFRALFPCGSITGAPKMKAMEIIAQVEQQPRGVYCGAIGIISPTHVQFNVAIRTVVVDKSSGQATCGLGCGITFDSSAEHEFEEVIIKSRFLDERPDPFELLETVLFDGEAFWLLDRHMERLARSAEHFGFACDQRAVVAVLENWRIHAPAQAHRVRVLVNQSGQVHIEAFPIEASQTGADPVVVPLARKPMSATNRFLFHKTTRREEYEQQSRDHPEAFDVLLWNHRGEITEFTRGNVVVEIDGQRWTPPIDCGLLGGTFREELLNRGEIVERILSREDVLSARRIWFVNSVRGWVEVMLDSFDALENSAVRHPGK